MTLLVRIMTTERHDNDTMDSVASKLHRIISRAYNLATPDGYYLPPLDPDKSAAEQIRLTDGQNNPDDIIKVADSWNSMVAADLGYAITNAAALQTRGEGAQRWLSVPNNALDTLASASAIMANQFHHHATRALLVGANRELRGRLTDAELNYIKEHPENYCICKVFPN